MVSTEKFEAKINTLRATLQRIGHVPSQTENRAVHANVKYYYQKYASHPLVQSLMTEYPWELKRHRSKNVTNDIDNYAQELEEKLLEYGRVPTGEEDRNFLARINYCYRNYHDNHAIQRLRKLYPTRALYSKWGPEVEKDAFPDPFYFGDPTGVGGISYYENPYARSKRYILECIDEFQELPGQKTWPMRFYTESLNSSYRIGLSEYVVELSNILVNKLCIDDSFKSFIYSALLNQEPLYNKIVSILAKKKICSLGYLAKNLVPGIVLSSEQLYKYFYYQDQNEANPCEGISKSHRHKFRLFDMQPLNKEARIVSLPFEHLRSFDFEKIASKIRFTEVPEYSLNFTEEEEDMYAKSFLFRHEKIRRHEFAPIQRKVDYSTTIIDMIRKGDCPFRFLNENLFLDDAEATLRWCDCLVDLESELLERYNEFLYSRVFNNECVSNMDLYSYTIYSKLSKYLKIRYDYKLIMKLNDGD